MRLQTVRPRSSTSASTWASDAPTACTRSARCSSRSRSPTRSRWSWRVGDRDEVVCPGVEGANLAAVALAALSRALRLGRAAGAGHDREADPDRGRARRRLGRRRRGAAPRGEGVGRAGARVEDLLELAPSIGADVASQVEPGSHLVLGAGEVVERMPKQWHLAAVLLTSERGLEHGGRLRGRRPPRHAAPRPRRRSAERLRQAATSAGYRRSSLVEEMLHNDLQKAARRARAERRGGARTALGVRRARRADHRLRADRVRAVPDVPRPRRRAAKIAPRWPAAGDHRRTRPAATTRSSAPSDLRRSRTAPPRPPPASGMTSPRRTPPGRMSSA